MWTLWELNPRPSPNTQRCEGEIIPLDQAPDKIDFDEFLLFHYSNLTANQPLSELPWNNNFLSSCGSLVSALDSAFGPFRLLSPHWTRATQQV